MTKCKLSPVGLGLALGVMWGVGTLIVGLMATYLAYGHGFVEMMGNLYFGYYEPTLLGSVLGGLIGFVDGFISGALLACLYNLFACECKCCKEKCE